MSGQGWAIIVVYRTGEVAYLRHGTEIGTGPVVRFRSKRLAEINVGMIAPGLEGETQSISVVKYPRKDPA